MYEKLIIRSPFTVFYSPKIIHLICLIIFLFKENAALMDKEKKI